MIKIENLSKSFGAHRVLEASTPKSSKAKWSA